MTFPLKNTLAVLLSIGWLAAVSGEARAVEPWYTTSIDDERTSLELDIGGNAESLYPRSYALVIGEVNYNNWPHLTAIPGELSKLTKSLERQHFKVDLYFDLASKDMTEVIDQFIKTRGATLDSRIVVYISAHGYSRNEITGKPIGYILPIDAPKDGSADSDIVAKALAMPMFSAWAQAPDPRHMFFIFDSCFSGGFFGYRGRLINPGLSNNTQSGPYNAGGFTVDRDGNIIPPPPDKRGIESSDTVHDPAPRSPGRQFLAAGDSTETVPGKSILAQLLVQILDDVNTRPQINADYWTTGSEIGEWIQHNGKNISRALFGEQFSPSPVYGHLPFDDYYQQGDIVFSRNDLDGIPVVKSAESETAWNAALARPILTDRVVVASAERDIQSFRSEAERQASIASAASARSSELRQQAAAPPPNPLDGLGLGADRSALLAQANNQAQLAEQARQMSLIANSKVQAATLASTQILEVAKNQQALVTAAVQAASPPEGARLSASEEGQLRALIDELSSDDTPTRRGARIKLASWLSQLPTGKQAITLERLLSNFSRKSYRFQLGVAQAIGEQQGPLVVADLEGARAEIKTAQLTKAGQEIALRGMLAKAAQKLNDAKDL